MGSSEGAAAARRRKLLRAVEWPSAADMAGGAAGWYPGAWPSAPALPRLLLDGVDTLQLHTKAPVRTEILAGFEKLHQRALQRKKEQVSEPVKWECLLDDELEATLEMQAAGSGGKGCRYRLEAEGVLTLLVHTHAPEGTPTCYVELASRFLWARGFREAARLAIALMDLVCASRHVGNLPLDPQVTRVDFCMDFDRWAPELSLFEEFEGRAVKRGAHLEPDYAAPNEGASVHTSHWRFTGFSFGRGVVVARLYWKSLEIKSSGKLWFRPLWQREGWVSEEESGPVWRLEFQLRREALRNAHVRVQHTADRLDSGEVELVEEIASWEHCAAAAGNIWKALARNWLSLRGQRTASQRVVLSDVWRELHDAPKFPQVAHAELYRYALDVASTKTAAATAGYLRSALGKRWSQKGQRPSRDMLDTDVDAVVAAAVADYERRHGDFFHGALEKYAQERNAALLLGDGQSQLELIHSPSAVAP